MSTPEVCYKELLGILHSYLFLKVIQTMLILRFSVGIGLFHGLPQIRKQNPIISSTQSVSIGEGMSDQVDVLY